MLNRIFSVGTILLVTGTALAVPNLGEIAKNADGSVKTMSQANAIECCKNQGGHLPTARELASYSQELGAAGIIEVADHKDNDQDSYSIGALNFDSGIDRFYFNYHGYQRPSGDLGNYWFWSSSGCYGNYYGYYVLNGNVGSIDFAYLDNGWHAVRCVAQ
jgi:hypothetical protein